MTDCNDEELVGFILLYQPPCGQWYVHSHKIYPTIDKANAAIERFISLGTPTKILNLEGIQQ